MRSIEITTYSAADAEAFAPYIDEAFHSKYILKDPRYIEWQFSGLYIAKAEGKIIGHFGYKELQYKVGGATETVRVLMNLYVLEPYRIFGIGALLVKKMFETDNPVFVAGYKEATKKVASRFRPKWQDGGRLHRYLAILDPQAEFFANYTIPTVAASTSIDGAIQVDATENFTDEVNDFWQRVSHRYGTTVERSKAYLDWRFVNHPFFDYNILIAKKDGVISGFLVWRIEEDQGFSIARIIDCISDEDAEAALFSSFLQHAKEKKAAAADFLFSGALYQDALKANGWFNVEDTDFTDFPTLFSPISYKKTFINIGYDLPTSFADVYATKADGDQDRPNPH